MCDIVVQGLKKKKKRKKRNTCVRIGKEVKCCETKEKSIIIIIIIIINAFRTRPVIEPKKFSIHGLLVGLVVEP